MELPPKCDGDHAENNPCGDPTGCWLFEPVVPSEAATAAPFAGGDGGLRIEGGEEAHPDDSPPIPPSDAILDSPPSILASATPPSTIVHAEGLFPAEKNPQPKLPEFTLADLLDLGVVFSETDESRLVEIPFETQKKLLESVKTFGFGAGSALDTLLQKALAVLGFVGAIKVTVAEGTFAWTGWQKKSENGGSRIEDGKALDPTVAPAGSDETAAIIAERGKVYGDPELSHENIGLNWTGMIQQHYQIRLPHAMPAWLIELMMAGFKIHRAARVFHEDNYVDLEAYGLRFAREHQRAAFAALETTPE